jgi:putative ABC transport system permease protein
VESAAAINTLPLDGHNNFPSYPEGRPEQAIGGTEVRAVTPGYFATMRVPVLRGRDLANTDSGTAALAIIVGEGLAKRWWPQGDSVGRHVHIGDASFEVVGVVGDTRRTDLQEPFSPTVYLAPAQYDYTGGMHWVLRGTFSAGFGDLLQQAIRQIDPRQRVLQIRAMDDIVASRTADSRFDAWIFGGFALLALLLTGIGLYGLVSFAVSSRIGEIGTRMALGASSTQVVRLVLWQGFLPVAAGLIAGIAAAFLLTRTLSSLLFQVRPADLSSYVAVAVVLPAILILASYFPARRATRIDPLAALRSE